MKNNQIDFQGSTIKNKFSQFIHFGKVLHFGFLALVLGLLFAGCGGKNGGDATAAEVVQTAQSKDTLKLNAKQVSNAGISVGPVSVGDVSTEIQLMGVVEASPQGRVSVGSLLGGMVKKIAVKAGDVVREGQTLCAIENLTVVDWQEGYLTAEADGFVLAQEAERQKELYQNKASSLKVYQQAESAWKGNLAKREALLQRLGSVGISKEQVKKGIQRLIWVKSSSAGVVESVLVHEGQTVSDNANLVEVVSNSGAQWVLSGFETQTSLVRVGMKVEMGPAEGGTSSVVNGRVAAVSPSIQSDRTWKIYCAPQSKLGRIDGVRVGQAIKGRIAVQSNNAYLLPESSVFQRDGKHFCFVKSILNQADVYVLTPIVVVGNHEQSVIISNPPKDPVVLKGAYSLWMMWDAQQSAEE
jgi:membrane fusion protein, heavy metal efflux system